MASDRRNVWAERLFGVLLIIIGAFLGKGLDYWLTFSYVATAVHAHLLIFAAHEQTLELQLALVNAGNRQGAVTEFTVVFPAEMGGGRPYLTPNPKDFAVRGIPVVLNAGDIRLVTIRGKLPLEAMYHNGQPVDPTVDGSQYEDKGIRKADMSIRIRALDFKGRRYQALWDLCKMFVRTERVAGWRIGSTEFKVFDRGAYPADSTWLSFPSDPGAVGLSEESKLTE